jgi:hypothetical protein
LKRQKLSQGGGPKNKRPRDVGPSCVRRVTAALCLLYRVKFEAHADTGVD